MPAVTFTHSTIHSSQNCVVRIALVDRDVRRRCIDLRSPLGGVHPAGRHPGAADAR